MTDLELARGRAPKRNRTAGTGIIWPAGIEQRYGIATITRVRWEKAGKLPPRDVHVGGRAVGWRPSTIEAAERGLTAA